MGGQQAAAARAIRGRATQRNAAIAVLPSPPFALAAFWGAKRQTGWYGARRYANSAGRQFREWVGNNWQPATFSGGPYAINPTLAAYVPKLLDEYGDAIERVAKQAFPEG
jgi:hypothetical protein